MNTSHYKRSNQKPRVVASWDVEFTIVVNSIRCEYARYSRKGCCNREVPGKRLAEEKCGAHDKRVRAG